MKKRLMVIGSISLVVIGLSAFTTLPKQKQKQKEFHPKNLQVLPQDITKKELMHTMRSFTIALNVECSFCHAKNESGKGLDFASDKKTHKEIARGMMMMVRGINKQYFDKYPHRGMVNQITCRTCHNGHKEPVHEKIKVADLK